MSEIKLCPNCHTEYFSHIEYCADCDAVLLAPEENKIAQEEKKRQVDKDSWTPVILRKGSLKWLDELCGVLTDSGIPCVVSGEEGCSTGGCGATYCLLVTSENAEVANDRVEEYCMEIHPEIKDSQELISQGKCPACGCSVNSDAVDCPDCGLTLMIVVDE